jgi:hypothetical protein
MNKLAIETGGEGGARGTKFLKVGKPSSSPRAHEAGVKHFFLFLLI